MKRLYPLFLASVLLTACHQASPSAAGSVQGTSAAMGTGRAASGNKMTLLVDAGEIFPAMNQAIDQAKSSVQIHAFQLGGHVGNQLAFGIIRAHERGVAVQVLVDPHRGAAGSVKEMVGKTLAMLEKAGVPVRDYDLKGLPKGPSWLSKVGVIDHSKALVVDGSVAFVGSMNFYDHAAFNHDYMVKIEGPAATTIGEIGNADWRHSGQGTDGMIPLRRAEPVGEAPVTVAVTAPQKKELRPLVVSCLKAAKKRIWSQLLFLDDDAIIDAMIAAKQRGADVRVVLDPIDWGNHVPELDRLPFNGIPNWAAVARLLDAGVDVRWYTPRKREENLHAKVTLVDDATMLMGSPNYTYRALDVSRETAVAFEDTGVAARFAAIFTADAARAKPVSLSKNERRLASLFDWVKRGIYREDEAVADAS